MEFQKAAADQQTMGGAPSASSTANVRFLFVIFMFDSQCETALIHL